MSGSEDLFGQICEACCSDGRVSADEFKLLQKVSHLLALDKDQANQLANNAIARYKAGELDKSPCSSSEAIYQNLLLKLSEDGIIDAEEDETLQSLKQLLGCDVNNFQKIDGEERTRKIRLKPLICVNCKGLLPLAKSEWVECPYCCHKNSIPRSYHDAVAVRASLQRHKSKLHEVRAAVGHVPTWFESVIANFSDYLIFFLFFLFLLFFQYYLNAIIFYPLVWYYEKYCLQNFFDFASPVTMAFVKAGVLYAILALPFAYIYRLKRKLAVLGPLQISLAAGAPVVPGGPSLCNNCGAGLVVEKNSQVVSCAYCETENIVGLPENWLKTARSRLAGTQKSSTAAFANYKKESGRFYETLASLAGLFVVFGIILASFYWVQRSDHFLPVPSPDQKHRQFVFPDKFAKEPFEFGKWVDIGFGYAPTSRNFVDLFVFLHAGDKLEVVWKPDLEYYRKKQEEAYYLRDVPVADRMDLEFYQTFCWRGSGNPAMKKLTRRMLMAGNSSEFVAEIGGYHNLRCYFPEYLKSFHLKIDRSG